MVGWQMNRSFGTCVVVFVVASVALFWLQFHYLFSPGIWVAGFLAGRLAGTTKKGALAALVGGFVVAALWGALVLPSPEATGTDFLLIALMPIHGVLGGAIGGWTGETVTTRERAIPDA